MLNMTRDRGRVTWRASLVSFFFQLCYFIFSFLLLLDGRGGGGGLAASYVKPNTVVARQSGFVFFLEGGKFRCFFALVFLVATAV